MGRSTILTTKGGCSSVAEVLMHEGDRHAPFADRRGDTFHGAEANVAAGEDPGDAGLQQIRVTVARPAPVRPDLGARQDVTALVERDLGWQPPGLRVGADEYEQAAAVV